MQEATTIIAFDQRGCREGGTQTPTGAHIEYEDTAPRGSWQEACVSRRRHSHA